MRIPLFLSQLIVLFVVGVCPLGQFSAQAQDPAKAQSGSKKIERTNRFDPFYDGPAQTTDRGEPPASPTSSDTTYTSSEATQFLKVFTLKHASALEMANIFKSVYGSSMNGSAMEVAADNVGNRLVVRSSRQGLAEIETIIKELDQPSAVPQNEVSGRGISGVGTSPLRAGSSSNTVDPNVREVFAAVDGEVKEVPVKEGDVVKQGDVLVELSNLELEANIAELRAKLDIAELAFQKADTANNQVPGSVSALEIMKLKKERDAVETMLPFAQERKGKLTVRSPVNGRVVTKNLNEQLIGRSVRRGELLLTLALPGYIKPSIEVVPGNDRPISDTSASSDIETRSTNSYVRSEQPASTKERLEKLRVLWNAKYGQVSSVFGSDQDKELEKLRLQIRSELAAIFDEKQASQARRAREMEFRLNELKQLIEDRKKDRDAIVDRQVDEEMLRSGHEAAVRVTVPSRKALVPPRK